MSREYYVLTVKAVPLYTESHSSPAHLCIPKTDILPMDMDDSSTQPTTLMASSSSSPAICDNTVSEESMSSAHTGTDPEPLVSSMAACDGKVLEENMSSAHTGADQVALVSSAPACDGAVSVEIMPSAHTGTDQAPLVSSSLIPGDKTAVDLPSSSIQDEPTLMVTTTVPYNTSSEMKPPQQKPPRKVKRSSPEPMGDFCDSSFADTSSGKRINVVNYCLRNPLVKYSVNDLREMPSDAFEEHPDYLWLWPETCEDDAKAKNTKCVLKKKRETFEYDQMPTIDDLLNESIMGRHFGYLNEVEYSSSFWLNKVVVQGGPMSRNLTRFYFDRSATISYTSAGNFVDYAVPGAIECKPFTAILRIDYKSGCDSPTITAKLRVVRTKFNVDHRFTVCLTGAIEMEVPELQLPMEHDTPKLFSKRRVITYWFVRLICRNRPYTFRVAFRTDQQQKTECNVECEDIIEPYLFATCFDLLYKYYRGMYLENDGVVKPTADDSANILPDLNKEQKSILQTLTLVDENKVGAHKDVTAASVACAKNRVDPNIGQFVKALAVQSYRYYVNHPMCIESQEPGFHVEKLERPEDEDIDSDDMIEYANNDEMFSAECIQQAKDDGVC